MAMQVLKNPVKEIKGLLLSDEKCFIITARVFKTETVDYEVKISADSYEDAVEKAEEMQTIENLEKGYQLSDPEIANRMDYVSVNVLPGIVVQKSIIQRELRYQKSRKGVRYEK